MSLLHVLFAVALPLRLIGTSWVFALKHFRRLAVLVVNMAISFFFVRPPDYRVLARGLWALRRTNVRFLVFPISALVLWLQQLSGTDDLREIAWPLEAFGAKCAFLVDVHRRSVLLPAGHRPFHALINRI